MSGSSSQCARRAAGNPSGSGSWPARPSPGTSWTAAAESPLRRLPRPSLGLQPTCRGQEEVRFTMMSMWYVPVYTGSGLVYTRSIPGLARSILDLYQVWPGLYSIYTGSGLVYTGSGPVYTRSGQVCLGVC